MRIKSKIFMKKSFLLVLVLYLLASCDLFEVPDSPEDPETGVVIPVSAISLNLSRVEIHIDASVQLKATVKPRDASYTLSWSSDDSSVASVDEEGLVHGISVGTATITASAGGQTCSCIVIVSRPEFEDYVDEYGVNHGIGTRVGAVIWAPVNCGYHATEFKHGKLYQWGRKYGQGGDGDVSTPSLEAGGVSSVGGNYPKNSGIFYLGVPEDGFDWTYPQDDHLWNAGTEYSPTKTGYDPCPEHWRLPTSSELEELCLASPSWNNEGSVSFSQAFLPFHGRRYGSDGGHRLRDEEGYYWSSDPIGSDAFCLVFDSGNAEIVDLYRSNGCSVRCVQAADEVAEL